MKHAASRELYAYWEDRRGGRLAPERADIEPGAIRQALSDTFILELADASHGHSFRLAGTRVCALFGRELKGESFINLWSIGSRQAISDLLTISSEESVGTVAGVTAESVMSEQVDLELLLLPLGIRRPKSRPHHRHSRAAQSAAVARHDLDRGADAGQPTPYWSDREDPVVATLHGAAPRAGCAARRAQLGPSKCLRMAANWPLTPRA